MLIKNVQEKAGHSAVFRVISTEMKNNLLAWCKVNSKRKTHFFKRSMTWYLHWKQVPNKNKGK